ncbi:MAG: RidA family protein [Kofleriaceae bacterium]|nr:RidA family protein [Myxococcales bacterium]MCB9564842.1 RidA family protein [Kofleriaceae bacterium]MCB9574156.1 RidA family protein [Kofleriaceae bacterium]
MSVEIVTVDAWPPPRGYVNGAVGTGRTLHVAGQVGWLPDGSFPHADLVGQFGLALDNVLAVVAAAGGAPTSIASMTVYVTDADEYRRTVRALGPVWRERMGRHYPAMALVAVAALVETGAKVEIQAVAYLDDAPAVPAQGQP